MRIELEEKSQVSGVRVCKVVKSKELGVERIINHGPTQTDTD